MDKNKKIRSTNIEMLRILAMLMIVIYHITYHCIIVQLNGGDSIIKIGSTLFNHPVFYKKLFMLNGIMPWGLIGNSLFLLISGYFMINSKKEIDINKTAKKLLLQLGFASLTLVIFSTFIYKIHITKKYIALIDISSFNIMAWFVSYYFLVILIAYLFLNKYLKKIDKKQYTTFLIIIFALSQFSWINKIVNGLSNELFTLLSGLFFYSLGGYLNKYNPFNKVKFITILLIIIMTNFFIFISSYNITATKIENYLINPSNGFTQSIMIFGNHSISVVILSICIFEIFTRMKVRNIKFINYIASGTFMVYLLHDNYLFYSLWGTINWISILYNSPLKFVVILIAVGLLTFTVGIIAYLVYNFIIKISLKYKTLFLKN